MTELRDPFATVHKKEIKNKSGQVVAQVDYVGWSQVADRLDEAAPGWSFTIRQLGDDWCWGTLAVDGRVFENIGYAENADMDWKKEPLKDAVSDALKRCAALAGVARYLYDKDSNGAHGTSSPVRTVAAAARPAAATNPYGQPKPHDDPYPDDLSDLDAGPPSAGTCPVHGVEFRLVPAGVSKRTNKAYDAFWSCPEMGCKEKPR